MLSRRIKMVSGLLGTAGLILVVGVNSWLSGDDAKPAAAAPKTAAPNADETSPRDRYKENLAGNEDVARVIRGFQGKGAVGDDSQPTPAAEAIKLFQTADGLAIDLIAAEPAVEQPLFMHFDDRSRLWVVQYRQYPFPEGLKVVRYDQYLRAQFDRVPQPPPKHVPGRDKITVFEDTNGDGVYDSHKDVITGLNIATSVLTGRGGIWVMNTPYLLFYPDANRDDIPDGDPEVHLTGFGMEDTHAVANSLIWGPDGWIYAAMGSTTTANVSSAVTKNVPFEGQCIWRYHPVTKVFEVFAEGGGNTFSSEIDARGRVFSGTNHGNTRGMYYPQGSYGEKNWGKHGPLTNPFAFGFFLHMKHEGDKDRFPQTFVIYEGNGLPDSYQGDIIAANALHNRVWASRMARDGSTYRTTDLPPIVTTTDRWFRPVDVKVGPDGAVYIADWYDTRLTHVDPRDNWHKDSGRIYRVRSSQTPPAAGAVSTDLHGLSDDQLIALFTHPNKWQRQTAVRVLGERLEARRTTDAAGHAAVIARLHGIADRNEPQALEALWALHLAGAFDDELAAKMLDHGDPDVRRWTVRLLGDDRRLSNDLAAKLVKLAKSEGDVQVRSQLASSAKRFATRHAIPILVELSQREEDLTDPHQPLLIWWGFEAHAGNGPLSDPQVGVPLLDASASPRTELLALFEHPEVWTMPHIRQTVLPRLMQRFVLGDIQSAAAASAGTAPAETGLSGLAASARLLELAPNDDFRAPLVAGFLEAYQGREIAGLPPGLAKAIEDYRQRIGNSDLALGLKLGNDESVAAALKVIRDESADGGTRLAYLDILGQINKPQVVAPLLGLLTSPSPAVKRAAMLTLMKYDDPSVGRTICSRFQSSLPDEHDLRTTAYRVLASRPVWTKQFLAEIEEFRVKPTAVPLDIVQQMRLHQDADIQKLLDKHWGRTRATPEEKQNQIARVRSLVTGAPVATAVPVDPRIGRELFRKNCATCHTLFEEGGQTGPNLTGYERDNLNFMLLALVDPSAAIREEFTQFQAVTKDGLVLNGLLDDQTATTVTLRGANNQTTVLNRDDVELLQAVETSLMPDGLLDKLTDDEVRHLFAYITRRTPLPSE